MLRNPFVAACVCFSLLACGGGHEEDEPSSNESASDELCDDDRDCDDGKFCNGEEFCQPSSVESDLQGCVSGPPPCLRGQSCIESDTECLTDCEVSRDADGDGSEANECGGDDCDDSSASRYPGNTEVCDADNIDEDCDPTTFGYRDADGDEYPDALCCNEDDEGELACGEDCDDQNARVHPTQLEICDGLDNDCNGDVDDIDGEAAVYYLDKDGDLFGDPESPLSTCEVDLEDYVLNRDDCDDTDPDINPAERDDQCDSVDNNCSGTPDDDAVSVYFVDKDGDGHGDPKRPAPPCSILGQGAAYDNRDCDDDDPRRSPDLPELRCDLVDNNCNGIIDSDGTEDPIWYVDADGDGYGDQSLAAYHGCDPGDKSKFTTAPLADCDDTRDFSFPGAEELCDGLDNNCSLGLGFVDDPLEDMDGDGHTSIGFTQCSGGYPKDDCNDNAAVAFPGGTEVCDGYDNDCDGALSLEEDVDQDGFAHAGCLAPNAEVDCLDSDPKVYPGAPNVCDNLVDDCRNPDVGTYVLEDADGDGRRWLFAECEGPPDCDDEAGSDSIEICDGHDNDCNDGVDEGCPKDFTLEHRGTSAQLKTDDSASFSGTGESSFCPEGQVLAGVHTIDSVRAYWMAPTCRPYDFDPFTLEAVLTGEYTTQSGFSYSSTTGSGEADYRCADAMARVGLAAEASLASFGKFSSIQGACRTVGYDQETQQLVQKGTGTKNQRGTGVIEWTGCEAHELPTGIHRWRSGDYYGFALECSEMVEVPWEAGATVAIENRESGTRAAIGSANGHVDLDCLPGMVLSGLETYTLSSEITGVTLRCARLVESAGSLSTGPSEYGVVEYGASYNPVSSDCPTGSAVTSVRFGGTDSSFNDAELTCSTFDVSTGAGALIELGASSKVQLGTPAGTIRTTTCPAGKLATGLSIRETGSHTVDAFALKCAEFYSFLP